LSFAGLACARRTRTRTRTRTRRPATWSSFVALQLNGSTAVTVSYLDHRVGFWNPAIDNAVASSFKRNKSHRPRTDVRPGAVASGQARQ
jgi:hypothetical protein